MWINLLEKEGADAVSAIAEDERKRLKEESILWVAIGKFGRLVIVSRKKYSHMRKCGDLIVDRDGNQARFMKLTEVQLDAYKTGNLRQNQIVCTEVPEDLSEVEVKVKAILKKDLEESKKIRADFIQHQADIKNKKEGNITVVNSTAPVVDDGKAQANADKEAELKKQEQVNADKKAELEVKEKELDAKIAKANEPKTGSAPTSNTPTIPTTNK